MRHRVALVVIARDEAPRIGRLLGCCLLGLAGLAAQAQAPARSGERSVGEWLQRMQEWMGPAARGQMIQNMTQVHGAAATGQMLQHMSQDDDCSGSEECVSAGMGGVFNGRGSVMDEGMMGGRD